MPSAKSYPARSFEHRISVMSPLWKLDGIVVIPIFAATSARNDILGPPAKSDWSLGPELLPLRRDDDHDETEHVAPTHLVPFL